jgi:hypothetical protein
MPAIKTGTDLHWNITIAREADEAWPPLDTGTQRWDVTEVVIRVTWQEDGTLTAGTPYLRHARRIRKDGTPGASISYTYTPYADAYGRDAAGRQEVAAQSGQFRQLALSAARRAFAALTLASVLEDEAAPAISQET